MLTAAVRDLKAAYPSIRVGVSTTAMELWNNNPNIDRSVNRANADRHMQLEYPLINQSDRLPYHFIHAFRKELELQLGLRIPQGPFKPDLYLTNDERNTIPLELKDHKYWVLDAGYKNDFTLKNWGYDRYCKLVELLEDKVNFVQIGAKEHNHKPIPGTTNIVGQTTLRELIGVIYNSEGVITPVSLPMHLAAGVPIKDGRLRPCIVLAGGREPATWEQYPGQQFLHTIGMLGCCRRGGCWKSRAKRLNDKAPADFSICSKPVVEGSDTIGKCMTMIEPEYVAKLIEMYEENK